jgi:hypothetical protein
MSENNLPQVELTSQDLQNAVYIFSAALSKILQDKQGIIIRIMTDKVVLPDNPEFVIVYKMDESIHIQKYDGDLEEGTVVNLQINENESND